ncbi:ras-related protein Rab-7L1-like isoform X1 [Oratosquilla oratoria]|uniref:ras-related protein Rab-7L1-like isoform X1 n=2 Tax=Oratosquilla oratoria TaxID=337810 RepID=UPI003F76559B
MSRAHDGVGDCGCLLLRQSIVTLFAVQRVLLLLLLLLLLNLRLSRGPPRLETPSKVPGGWVPPERNLSVCEVISPCSDPWRCLREGPRRSRRTPEEEVSEMSERLFKVIIIGDPTVGKTSFVQRYVQDSFRRDYKGTVGVDFALKILKWSDSETIKLQLWDIAGQERFTWMTRVYYKDAQGCIIMFDLTNRNSFLNTLKWKKDVDSKCTLEDGSPIPCMLLANKCDLPHRQVDQLEIERLYKEHAFTGWTETSAKEGLMVTDSMRFLVDVMMKQTDGRNEDTPENSIRITPQEPDPSSSCYC